MARNKEYELAIKIAGEVERSFLKSTKLTKRELQSIARTAARTSSDIKNSFGHGINTLNGTFDTMSSTATKAFKTTTRAAKKAAVTITGIGAVSTIAGSGFESAFTGVKKTVDATDAELMKLEQDIRNVAKDMPTTANELAGIAESAGQLGIETENVANFTRTMADLGESTNLTSEEGAKQFARFTNITGMSQDNFERLGSTVVALGNDMATTESEITEMAMRLAGAGTQVNMSESQILGIAAALSSVGIESEAGGSAFSKVMVNMQLATETGKNGLEDYAKVAGMTAKEFQKAFKKDAAGAMISFVDGLKNAERNGMSAISVLDSMKIKEVRLRDALLRASNASDMFSDSINISDEAWRENVALTNEAAQRYATFESKLGIFKNVIKDVGISVYKDMREPLADGVDTATQFVKTLAGKIDSKNVISELVKSFTTKLPTAIRRIKEFTKAFLDFVDPLLQVGNWLLQHPDVIVSTIAGIGAAIATYKVAQRVNSLVQGFTSLAGVLTNPFALAILAVGAAIGGAVSIATYVSKANKEMKKQNLAEHFGDISLSLEELKEVAGHIVQTDNLGKLRESLSAIEDMKTIKKSIGNAVESLNKMNWKVSIGMELSEDEQQEYKDNITSYIADVQELVSQKQYAVSIAVGVLLGDEELEESNVVTQMNTFYANKQKELAEIGTKLNETVTEAFKDELLMPDEIKVITDLQSQMASIQSKLAGSQFDAKLEVLKLKYAGGELDAETFQNLQNELNEQVQEAVGVYDESLELSISNANCMLEEGAIDEKECEKMKKELHEGYLKQIGDIELGAVNFQLDTITDQYSEELEKVMPNFKEALQKGLDQAMKLIPSEKESKVQWTAIMWDIINVDGLDSVTQDAMKDLFAKMEPSVAELEELKGKYKEFGIEVPKAFADGISEVTMLDAVLGNTDAIFSSMGELAKGKEYVYTLEKVHEAGAYIPEELASAIEENKKALEEPVKRLYSHLGSYSDKVFSNGISIDIPITLDPQYSVTQWKKMPLFEPADHLGGIGGLVGHADGGIFDTPHVAWFAEAGPEAAIPLDGSRHAIELWRHAGQLLGIRGVKEDSFDGTNSDSFTNLYNRMSNNKSASNSEKEASGSGTITYSPVLKFYGDSPRKEDLDSALETSKENFDTLMRGWIKDNGRLSFT